MHISTRSYLKALGIILAILLAWFLSDIIIILFLAVGLAAVIEPYATAAHKRGIPRAVAVLGIYVVLVAVVSLILSVLVPALARESQEFFRNFNRQMAQWVPSWIELQQTAGSFGVTSSSFGGLGNIGSKIGSAALDAFSTVRGVIGNVVTFMLVLVIAFYMVVEEEALRRLLKETLSDRQFLLVSQLYQKVQVKIGAWLRGQLILMLVVAGLTYLGLTILGVKYAAVLALFAGLMEFIPYAGPLLAAIPAVLMGLTDSPVKGGLVAAMGILIQQAENHILVPKIMQKVTGLNPVISIIAVMIGAKAGGVIGALLAIPVATALTVILQDYRAIRAEMAEL